MKAILMLGRRVCVLFSSLGLLLVGMTAVEAQGWTKHSHTADGFEVEFSGKVQVSPTDMDADTRTRIIRATNCTEGQFHADARYFTVGRWFYQVLALHPINGSLASDARRFVESFRVTGKGKR
jgi:hypothetical protein